MNLGILPALAFLFFIDLQSCNSESFVFENSMGIAYEFKIQIDSGKEECFYQHINQGSSLYVAFQVMRGGDGMAGFAVRHPNGHHVLPYEWKANTQYEEQSADPGGYYEVCIDNSASKFASKLVSLYLNSFKRDEWDKYVKDTEDLDVTVKNFTETLQRVDDRIGEMLKYQDHSRRLVSKDAYVVLANNRYVQQWSIAQCIIIIISSSLQVYFVRKLFNVKDMTPTAKPRA